jgi:Lon protease-like protein
MRDFDRIEERELEHGTVKYFVTDAGQKYTHYECERRLQAAIRATSRWFSRTIRTMTVWKDADMNASEIRDLRWILGDMANYVEVVSRELDRIEGVNRSAERVAALRSIKGRTPEEAALFLAKADEIEAGR